MGRFGTDRAPLLVRVMPNMLALQLCAGRNNYLRAAAYRKLYDRYAEGPRKGECVNLNFQNLVDPSAIDRRLREALLAAAVDVEHFAKVRLLARCQAEGGTATGNVHFLAHFDSGIASR